MARRYKSRPSDHLLPLLAIGVFISLLAPSLTFFINRNLPIFAFFVFLSFTALLILIVVFIKFSKRTRKLNLTFSQIDSLSGHDFEVYIAQLLQTRGYKTKVVGGAGGGDYGVDIIAEKAGVKTAVQVKRWNWVVGIEAVYQAVAGAKYYDCSQSMVITNNSFTPQALTLARVNACALIDRQTLKNWLITSQSSPSPH